MHPSRRKELEKLAFGQCLLAGLRGGQVFEDAMTTIPQENTEDHASPNYCLHALCSNFDSRRRKKRWPVGFVVSGGAAPANLPTRPATAPPPLAIEAYRKTFFLSVAIRNSFTAGATTTPSVRQEDPQMLPNIPNYQCGADLADIRLTPANVRFWG